MSDVLSINTTSAGIMHIHLIDVPPGQFLMGSADGLPYAPEDPIHRVQISRGFRIGQFPVTQTQFLAVTGSNPSYFSAELGRPVENICWNDAQAFCEQLSELSGQNVRLPSEAEWEYACRAGTETEYYFGDDRKLVTDHAWFEQNSGEETHPVGLKRPNAWDLFDMIGNVWEWCEDDWHGDYAGAPADGSPWLTARDLPTRKCVRGGAWNMDAFRCRSSYRSFDWSDTATNRLGFRIVISGAD